MGGALALALYAHVEGPTWLVGWFVLVPWLALLDRAGSFSATLATALLLAIVFVLVVFTWFAGAIASYTGAPPVLAVVALGLAAPLLEPQLLALAVGRYAVRRRGFWWATFAGAFLYVGTEWAFPKLFTDTLGHGLFASRWLRQAADVTGTGGLTFLLLVGNACVLEVLRAAQAGDPRRARAPGVCVVTVVAALALYGALRCRQLAPGTDGAVTAALVQGNVSQYARLAAQRGTYEAVRTILNLHFALSGKALRRAAPDILVWPETVYPTTFGSPKSEDGATFDRAVATFAAGARVPLVFGAYDVEDGAEYNAAVFLEPPGSSGRLSFETYRKVALFPLTERVPALLESPAMRRWLPWLGTWKPGPGPAVIPFHLADGRTLRVAPLICYDALDPRIALAAVRAGAEVIVTLSNDSWFTVGAGPRLHLLGSAFRSIETRRPQLRATNTGISAVIDATGEVLATAGVNQRATVVGTVVPQSHAWSLVLAWGDWLGPVALAAGVTLLSLAALRARRV